MKKVTEIEDSALMEYAENSAEIKQLENKINELRNQVERLCERSNIILKTGKKPIVTSDDIPF